MAPLTVLHGTLALVLALPVALSADQASASELIAPRLFSPVDGMVLTDIATSFAWAPIDACNAFDIEVATTPDFRLPVVAKHLINKTYHRNCYRPKDALPAGSYHWRVRAVRDDIAGPWSVTSALTVTSSHPIAPAPIRAIGPATPLFIMRSRAWDPLQHSEHVQEIIPPGLEHVIVIDDIALASERVMERAQRYQELGLDFVIWNNRCQVPLSTLEYTFQRYSHCLGTAEGEHFSGMYWEKGPEGNLAESDYVHHAWALCAKYGRFYFFADGDGGSYRWPDFAQREQESLARYHDTIVLMFKSTNGDMALHSYGAMQGFMAAGTVAHTGTWVDEWIWPSSGFGALGEIVPPEQIWQRRRTVGTHECPWIYDIQMWLMGIASGSTVFQLESAHQWSPSGAAQPHYQRVFLPFVKAVVAHRLIPSHEAFMGGIRVAVTSDPELAKGKHDKRYTGAFAYLHDLYALAGPGDQEFIPNRSRYGIVCLLPPGVTNLPPPTHVVAQRELLDPAAAVALFDHAYPLRFTGDAFMWACDGTLIITNANENVDRDQSFGMPLAQAPFTALAGTIGVHQYLVGKLATDGSSCWFQANGEDPERRLEVAFSCHARPTLATATPATCAMRWDEAGKRATVAVDFTAGAVEWELRP